MRTSLKTIIFAFTALILALSTASIQAATFACNEFTSAVPVPAGFGAAYDVDNPATLLIKGNCDNSANSASFTVGDGSASTYVYRQGYFWRDNKWQPFNIAPSGTVNGDWLIGSGQALVQLNTSELDKNNHIVAYTCKRVNDSWKCGCRDSACAASYWQIQRFRINSANIAYPVLKTPSPPAIDGLLGEYANANQINLSNSRGTAGNYRLLYDSTALYIAAQVSDSELNAIHYNYDANLWEDDSIELFFDTLHNAGTSMVTDDYKFFVNLNNTHRDERGGGTTDIGWNTNYTSAVKKTTNSYAIEIAIPWSNWGVIPPISNNIWGFDLSMNDRNNAGARIQTVWNNSDGDTSNNPDGWGEIMFMPDLIPPICTCSGTACNSENNGQICDGCSYITAPAETCGNGLDDNCNGLVDDGCDKVKPVVTAFDVQPRTSPGAVTASFTVTDNVALSSVELWRAPYNATTCNDTSKTGCTWTQVNQKAISGTSYTGTMDDAPAVGVWWYGLHVADTANPPNVGYEPNPPGSIKITVIEPLSLISHWPLDNNANDIIGGYNGTLSGNPSWTTGIDGGALAFDGIDDYVNIGDMPVFDNATALSVSFWIKPGVNQEGSALQGLTWSTPFSKFKADPTPDKTFYAAVRADNNVQIEVHEDSNTGTDYKQVVGTGAKLNAGQWAHVVATFKASDPAGLKLYVNGSADPAGPTDTTAIPSLEANATPVRFGNSADNTWWYAGLIDDIRLYNYVLTAAEVTDLYNAFSTCVDADGDGYDTCRAGEPGDDGKLADCNDANANVNPGKTEVCGNSIDDNCNGLVDDGCEPTAGLILHYKLDEVSGQTVYDSTANKYNGILEYPQTWTPGIIAGSLQFDGAKDYIDLAASGLASRDYNAVTLSAWYKSSKSTIVVAGDDADEYIFVQSTTGGIPGTWPWLELCVSDDVNHIGQVRFKVKKSWFDSTVGIVYGTTNIVDKRWHHITAVRTGNGSTSRLKIYVDGKLEADVVDQNGGALLDNAPGDPTNPNQPNEIYVGAMEWWGDYYMNGYLDDFRIYSRALSDSEITSLYNMGDNIRPIITAFDVQPRTTADAVTASFTVTDNVALSRVELYRAPFNASTCNDTTKSGCVWSQVNSINISGTTHTGTLTNTPATGVWWYGLHVVDRIGNVGTEPNPPGVIKVTSNAGLGLVAHYKFDEGSGATAIDSAKGNNAAITGATYTAGVVGNHALQFDGNDYAIAPDTTGSPLDITGSLTLASWVKFKNSVNGDPDIAYVLAKGQYFGSNPYRLVMTDGGLAGLAANTGVNNYIYGGTGLKDDKWHHIAGVYDTSASLFLFYVDGVQVKTKAITGNVITDNTSLSIGGWGPAGYRMFSGAIDDARVYNYALSAAEINALFKLGDIPIDCGDGSCIAPETCSSCPADCGACFSVTITNPADGAKFPLGASVIFQGIATGGTSPYNYSWSSSIDGFLGNGQTITIPQ